MFEAFAESDYRRFWTTQFISNIGSWMQSVAQGWLVYRLTDSAFLLGFVGFASFAPTFFLMFFGGVVADHFDRKRVVAISQWAQAGSALWLAIAIKLGHIGVWQIICASLVVGVAISFSAPAWQAMVVDLLDDRRRLPNAVAMNSLQFNFSRALGPLLAGATLSAWGSFWCFFLNALSFLPLIFILGRIKQRQSPPAEVGQIVARMKEGFAYVRRDRVVLLLLAIVAAASLGYAYRTLMPMLARILYGHDDARGLGILMGAIGVGALIGSLTISMRTPRRMMPLIIGTLALFCVSVATVGYVKHIAYVLVLLAICGGTMVVGVALCNTSIQQLVPDAMRGRVLSMYTFAFFAFLPFGNLGVGVVAEHYGLPITLVACGSVVALALLTVPLLPE